MFRLFSLLVFVGIVASCETKKADDGFTSLFNGKDMKNWHNPYSWGDITVVDGEVQLTTKRSKFFVLTNKKYADFIFEVEVKMPEGKSNSGFLFRCHEGKNKAFGYQAEVDPSDRKWSGGLYDEGRRGWIHPKKGKQNEAYNAKNWPDKRKNAFKRHDWNKYKIQCIGNHIKIWVNGVLTTDLKDNTDKTGFIGLQHHGEKGKVYRFRNIRIKELTIEKTEK